MTNKTNILRRSVTTRLALFVPAVLLVLFSAFRVAGQVAMPDMVCVGATKHYWVGPTPGSIYTWKINGVTQTSQTNEIYITWDTPYTPAGSPYTLTVQEQSVNGCFGAVQSGLVYVNQSLPVSISIAPDRNPACDGTPVTFTSTVANGGTNPVYAWQVNNGATAGTAASFTYMPADGDMVTCALTSNALCVTNNPTTSPAITMTIKDTPAVTFISCFDNITTLNAKPFKLKGGLPLNGIYSGPGVLPSAPGGFIFSPAAAGLGTKTVHYTYTNADMCSASQSKDIEVQTEAPFTCGNNWIDIRDNNKAYPTIQIGTQCWLAANLNYGSFIPSSQVQEDNCITEKYCYNNLLVNGDCQDGYGFYEWDELMKYDNTPASQGICPPGWHIPVESEWMSLFDFYGGNALAGDSLQDLSGPGFHALPGGVLYQNNSWSFRDVATFFWSSTPSPAEPSKVISHGMNIYDASVSYYESLRANAFPVRCLRD